MTRPARARCSSTFLDPVLPHLVRDLVDVLQPVGGRLVRAEQPERLGVLADHVPEPGPQRDHGADPLHSRLCHRDRVVLVLRQLEVPQQHAAVRVRGGAHPEVARGRVRRDVRAEAPGVVEELVRAGTIRATPPAAPDAPRWCALRTAAPGGSATFLPPAARRPPWARSSPSASAARSRASAAAPSSCCSVPGRAAAGRSAAPAAPLRRADWMSRISVRQRSSTAAKSRCAAAVSSGSATVTKCGSWP